MEVLDQTIVVGQNSDPIENLGGKHVTRTKKKDIVKGTKGEYSASRLRCVSHVISVKDGCSNRTQNKTISNDPHVKELYSILKDFLHVFLSEIYLRKDFYGVSGPSSGHVS